MTSSTTNALAQTGLNDFLFSEVGAEPNGMALSVISVFARNGADPWAEAGRLARLPKAAAIDSLARTIASMSDSLWTMADASSIATRLIERLPGGIENRGKATHATPGRAASLFPKRAIVVAVVIGLGVTFTITAVMQSGTELVMGGESTATARSVTTKIPR